MDMSRKYVFALLAIGTVVDLFNLGGGNLWEPDETRYAVIAREMKEQIIRNRRIFGRIDILREWG
jgi:4-amino-4-deoxy-L-arabinose transferase-like glycosyltransferase